LELKIADLAPVGMAHQLGSSATLRDELYMWMEAGYVLCSSK